MKKIEPITKFLTGACLLLAALYAIGVADLDYGYYTFLRVFSLITLTLIIVVYAFERETFLTPVSIVCGIILILFNPIIPIYLDKDVWIVLDILSAVSMLGLVVYLFKTKTAPPRAD